MEKTIRTLEKFREATYELLGAWDKYDLSRFTSTTDNYPFEKSFDDLAVDIDLWITNIIKDVNWTIKPNPYKLLQQIKEKDPQAYVEVYHRGKNLLYVSRFGIAELYGENAVKIYFESIREKDLIITKSTFNEDFEIVNINWGHKGVDGC